MTDNGSNHIARRQRRPLGHRFKDPSLLVRAVHARVESPRSGWTLTSGWRFLGDSVLGLVVSERDLPRYPTLLEGGDDQDQVTAVSRQTCAMIRGALGLDELLITGKGMQPPRRCRPRWRRRARVGDRGDLSGWGVRGPSHLPSCVSSGRRCRPDPTGPRAQWRSSSEVPCRSSTPQPPEAGQAPPAVRAARDSGGPLVKICVEMPRVEPPGQSRSRPSSGALKLLRRPRTPHPDRSPRSPTRAPRASEGGIACGVLHPLARDSAVCSAPSARAIMRTSGATPPWT